MPLEKRSSEANWFRKIAWNSALQCEDCPRRMHDFFILSFQLSQLCLSDKTIFIAQKTCLLMAAAASLELGRTTSASSDQTEKFTQALEHIQICWEIWKTLKSAGDLSKDPTETLLLIYEFEARAKINDSTLEHVLEAVLELQHLEPKTLETIASLAMEPPAHFPSVCKKALKNAWLLHRKCSLIDGVKCSKCLHSLIQLTLPSGTLGIEPRILEEVWSYYEEGLFVIDSVHDYPEVEILWLMTRAWNTGILLYSVGRYMEAERWCGLGMRFLKHLGSLQSSYESQMSGLYSEVLDRLDRAKRLIPNEE